MVAGTVGAVEFFAYVFVGLGGGIAAVAHERAIGVGVVHLLHVSVCVGHYAVVAQVVLDVIMVCGFSTVAEGHISTVEEQAAEHAILIDPVACILAPRVHQLAAVAGYAELLAVGHGRGVGIEIVIYPQLLPVGRVGVVYVAAVVEIYAARQAVAA